jgi:hypothetical protein
LVPLRRLKMEELQQRVQKLKGSAFFRDLDLSRTVSSQGYGSLIRSRRKLLADFSRQGDQAGMLTVEATPQMKESAEAAPSVSALSAVSDKAVQSACHGQSPAEAENRPDANATAKAASAAGVDSELFDTDAELAV